MSKRWTPAGYDDWKCTDPDAEGDDSADDTDDAQEPDDEPEYTYWRHLC